MKWSTERPEIDSHKYSQWFFDKRAKSLNGQRITFPTNGAGTTGLLNARNKKESRHRPYTFN